MAAPVFQAINGTAASASGVTTAVPASIAAGDLCISMCMRSSGTVNTVSVSAGYTIIQQIIVGAFRVAIAYRVAAGTTGNAPTWTWTGGGACSTNVSRYTGATSTPIGASSAASGTGTAVAGTAITAQATASTILCDIVADNAQTIPNPTGYTSKSTNTSAPAERTTNKATVSVGDSSTTAAVTITSANWVMFLVELQSTVPPTSGIITQTLKLITQAAAGSESPIGPIVQTLKLITQAASGTATGAFGSATQTLKLITQSASGWHSIFGTSAQTLKLITQSATGLQWVKGPIVQTLKLITQSATGLMLPKGTIVQTLKLITQSATGAMWAKGSAAMTLKLVTQAAKGWHTIFGTAAQVLKLLNQQINGFELTLDTLFVVTKTQLNAAIAAIEKQIRTTWHGPPDDPLPPLP